MIFNSSIYGKFEYKEDDIISFKKCIPGFDGLSKFIFVKLEECQPFNLLQSIEDENIGFIVISPFDFFKDYEIELTDEVVNNLETNDSEDIMLLTTVTLNSDPEKITTNLRAPFIINISNNLGEQIILDNPKYEIKHPLNKERR